MVSKQVYENLVSEFKMKSFREYVLSEATFGYKETKYIPAVVKAIKNGDKIKLGKAGDEGEVEIVYNDAVKQLESNPELIKGTLFTAKNGKTYSWTNLFKGTFSGMGGKVGKLSGADWEKVIVVGHNMEIMGMSEEEAVKEGDVDGWGEKYQGALQVGIEIAKNSGTPAVVMKHYGSDTVELSKGWDEYFIQMTGKGATAATKTPKTDMYLIDGTRLSLKKAGGSQLMSGGQAETLATLMFAYDNTPSSIKDKAFDSAFESLTDNVVNHFSKFNDVSITDIKKDIKAGKKSEMIDAVKTQLEKNKEMTEAIIKLTENSEFKKSIVREAMTGQNKFKTDLAISTHMMVFDENGNGAFKAIDDKIVSEYAGKTRLDISMKSASGNSWVALKGIVQESADDMLSRTLSEATLETEVELNEGFKEFVGGVITKVKDFIISIIKKWIMKITQVAKQSLGSFINLLGVELKAGDPVIHYKI